jgi:hypothetical protein
MRNLDLGEFEIKTAPTESSDIGTVLLRNRYRNRWPNPRASLQIMAVMVSPNDEIRRRRFLDAFTALYGEVGESSDGTLMIAGRAVQIRELCADMLDYLAGC